MEQLLGPMGLKLFQDDVGVALLTVKDHICDNLQLLEKLTYKAGLRIQLKKCKPFVKEATILGSVISSTGIRMDPLKIKAITNWPRPVDAKALQQFLGAANFRHEFSHQFSTLAAPMENVRNVSGNIDWTDERIRSFESIKNLFSSELSL